MADRMKKETAHAAPVPRAPMKEGLVAAVDYETFYDTRQKYSLTAMTPYDYIHDLRFDAYLVAVAFSDGSPSFVGHPTAFDWRRLDGIPLIAHNAAFDALVTEHLMDTGVLPRADRTWYDTADLAAFLGVRRSLKDAMADLYGEDISKEVRAGMNGRMPCNLTGQEYADLLKYGASDAEECLRIWTDYSGQWPEIERAISRQNREAGWRGVKIDVDAVHEGLDMLRKVHDRAENSLPWVTDPDPRRRAKAGSRPALLQAIRDLGIDPPKSVNKKSPVYIAWCEEHKDDVPFLQARVDLSGTTSHIKRLERLLEQKDTEDILRPSFLYFGAHTGRSSAGRNDGSSENVNMLNLPKSPVYGVDMRGMYIPRPGHKFIVYDYSQVEARGVLWLAGARGMLDLLKDEGNLYQANAVNMGWWPAKSGRSMKAENKPLYQLSKMAVLGLGYGMSAARFVEQCAANHVDIPVKPRDEWPELDRRLLFMLANMLGITKSMVEASDKYDRRVGQYLTAVEIVDGWRGSNPEVVGLWEALKKDLMMAAARGEPVHYLVLPSGREKPYWFPRLTDKQVVQVDPVTGEKSTKVRRVVTAQVVANRPRKAFTGGALTENVIQSTFRDAMFYSAVEVEKMMPECRFCWNCYDEIIFEVPEDRAEEANRLVPQIMCHGPHLGWAEGMPLEVDGGILDKYAK